MSERFYTNCPLRVGSVELTGPEAHHLATVCRLRAGDLVCLFNGDGHEYPARIHSVGKRVIMLEVLEQESPSRELPFFLCVAAPLPKRDRAQFLVEKLTELGVTTFVPLSTQRSVIQPREAKLEKLQRHVVEASKQCGRNVLMEVTALAEWAAHCRRDNPGRLRLLGHPGAASPKLGDMLVRIPAAGVSVAVGPEGGFTDEEVQTAMQAGWQPVSLGPRILRIETAALALAVCFAASADARTP